MSEPNITYPFLDASPLEKQAAHEIFKRLKAYQNEYNLPDSHIRNMIKQLEERVINKESSRSRNYESDKVEKTFGNHTSNTIISAPGSLVLKVAELLCSRKDYERVFLQTVLDMREEYNEALFQGRKRKAQWVLIRSYLYLAWSVTLQIIEFLLSGPAKIIKTLWTSS
jgi:hypothetical protein